MIIYRLHAHITQYAVSRGLHKPEIKSATSVSLISYKPLLFTQIPISLKFSI